MERIAESRLAAALAIPRRNLVLLDLSKMSKHAFVLETTMKHELCHLLLHHYINEDALPKWFDEGVCQWVSNGMAEIIMEGKVSILDEAVLAGKIVPLQQLSERFPGDDRSLILAYEQSESIVTYISQKYGIEKLLLVLNRLRDGKALQEAVKESLGISFPELESNWQRSLKKEHTWLLYVSMHLYEILFFVAALLTVAGFVRLIRRRKSKSRRAEEEEEIDEDEVATTPATGKTRKRALMTKIISRPLAALAGGRRGAEERPEKRKNDIFCPEWLRGPFRATPSGSAGSGKVSLMRSGRRDISGFPRLLARQRDAMREILSENSEQAHAYSQVSLSISFSSALTMHKFL